MKTRFEIITNPQYKDLNPIFFGYSVTKDGYTRSPGIRNFTLVYYVEKGCAEFHREGKQYDVGEGEIMIMPSSAATKLVVSDKALWNAVYIGFDGDLSFAFASLPAVMKYPPEIFDELYSIKDFEGRKDARLASWLMKLYSEIIPEKKEKPLDYVSQIKEYINASYHLPISVAEIAKQMNMNQSYLCRVFKKKTGKSIQEYIVSTRLKHAKQMLINDGKNVTEAALLCGFNSSSHFSKMFKRYYGFAPKKDRDLGKEIK